MNHLKLNLPMQVARGVSPRRERTKNVLPPTAPARTETVTNPNEKCSMPPSSMVTMPPSSVARLSLPQILTFRPYQTAAFNSQAGLEVWLWARQTGKSYTLAAWAIHRLLTRPGRLVTILSNSKTNGIELNRRCAEICQKLGHAYEQLDLSPDTRFETFNTETRITLLPLPQGEGRGEGLPITGRIKILAANPRTARGFSGDLILDEFAFHENAQAIWEAAEPILAANPDYLCRIASTPNGKHNLFYQLATNPNIPLRKITRTDAYTQGCQIYHPITRAPITPTEARNIAHNKRAYDQNYECAFEDQNMALLTHDLITAAERPNVGLISEQDWNPNTFPLLNSVCSVFSVSSVINPQPSSNPTLPHLYAGIDVARHHDQTVITVLEKQGPLHIIRAILRLRDMRLPDQQERLAQILSLHNLIHAKIDMTGLGLGLFEFTHTKFPAKITGINFASTIPLPSSLPSLPSVQNSSSPSVRITEYLATQLLQTYEDRAIHQPIDNDLREDLRKPERLISPSGRVSIAATRDAQGHADHFWSLALAIDAAKNTPRPPIYSEAVEIRHSRTGTKPGRAPRKHHFHRR